MQSYRIFDRDISDADAGFEEAIRKAYSSKVRPVCLCRRDANLRLYIARRNNQYVVARWPNTGSSHAPYCDHYEAPDHLTGLGQVLGSAIVTDDETGETYLKFAFPLSKGAARQSPTSLTNDKPDVKSTGTRLTIRGLLHFLWDRGELTHWHPKMAGKRSWGVVRRSLVSATVNCQAKGENLSRVVYVPEPWRSDYKEEIASRRRSELSPVYSSVDGIMVVIGEVKDIENDRFGGKIILRHLADFPFTMDEDMARRFHKRFSEEIDLWRARQGDSHLIMGASFGVSKSHVARLFEVSLMPVTPHWLPFESLDEDAMIRKAVEERRRFVKGLRLNLSVDKPIASITLKDTGEEATALYLARNLEENQEDDPELAELMQTPGLKHALWKPGDALPPSLRFLPAPRFPERSSASQGSQVPVEAHREEARQSRLNQG